MSNKPNHAVLKLNNLGMGIIPMGLLGFFNYLILSAILWTWGRLNL